MAKSQGQLSIHPFAPIYSSIRQTANQKFKPISGPGMMKDAMWIQLTEPTQFVAAIMWLDDLQI